MSKEQAKETLLSWMSEETQKDAFRQVLPALFKKLNVYSIIYRYNTRNLPKPTITAGHYKGRAVILEVKLYIFSELFRDLLIKNPMLDTWIKLPRDPVKDTMVVTFLNEDDVRAFEGACALLK